MFLKNWWLFLLMSCLALLTVAALMIGLAAALIYPDLPSLEALTNYQPKLPLRVYSEDGYLLAEYGEERRGDGVVVALAFGLGFCAAAVFAAAAAGAFLVCCRFSFSPSFLVSRCC